VNARRRRGAVAIAAIAGFAMLGACRSAPMQLPAGFVELRDAGEGWRAITSDGARLRVRALDDPSIAPAQFWIDTLRADLVQRGYELIGSGEVKNAAGGDGRWLELAANVRGERVGYLVAVWPVEPSFPFGDPFLRVVELAARDDVFRVHVDAVRSALSTVRG
jgi:hypothetical protein